jgi:hypothetical protein
MLLTGCELETPATGSAAKARILAARARGEKEAAEEIAAGRLKIKEYPPLPAPAWHGDYVRLLKTRCGVDYQVPQLPPDVPENDFIEEIHGFNAVMMAEIRKRFGDHIFDELQDQVRPRKGRKGRVEIG